MSLACMAREKIFQFTPLREGRHQIDVAARRAIIFQFTPLREGRPLSSAWRGDLLTYFNSRPCVRGDKRSFCMANINIISIHAPA